MYTVLNTTEDTAVVGKDFAGEGTRKIEFASWENRKTVRLAFLNDRVPEETEQFFVKIVQPVNDEIVRINETCITVLDEDSKYFNITESCVIKLLNSMLITFGRSYSSFETGYPTICQIT